MTQYQTVLYQAVFLNERLGWDYGLVVFESEIEESPTDAMMYFNNESHIFERWIGIMRLIENGEIIEEEMFDSSVIKED